MKENQFSHITWTYIIIYTDKQTHTASISLVEGLPPRLIMSVYYMLYLADFMDNSRELCPMQSLNLAECVNSKWHPHMYRDLQVDWYMNNFQLSRQVSHLSLTLLLISGSPNWPSGFMKHYFKQLETWASTYHATCQCFSHRTGSLGLCVTILEKDFDVSGFSSPIPFSLQ